MLKMGFNKNNLVLSSDDNFIQHLAVTVCSVLENRRSDYAIDIHILDGGISEENKNKIKQFIPKYENVKIDFYQVDESYFKDLPKLNESLATYYRLLIPEILPSNIDKVVYLDCDIVVNLDIKELFDIDLGDYLLGAVEDLAITNNYKRRLGINESSKYFNAGVLLLNLNLCRQYSISRELLSFSVKNSSKLILWDQDVLNRVLEDKVLFLNDKFNYIVDDYCVDSLGGKVIHYSGPVKPWNYYYIGDNKKYYFHYFKKTPWEDFVYKDRDFMGNLKKLYRKFIPKKIIVLIYKFFYYLKNYNVLFDRIIFEFKSLFSNNRL